MLSGGLGLADQSVTNWSADPSVRIVKGQPHKLTDRIWQTIKGKPVRQESGVLLVRPVVKEQVSPEERLRLMKDYNSSLTRGQGAGGSPPPPLAGPPAPEIYRGLIALTNYTAEAAGATKEIVFRAAEVGTVKTSLGQAKLFDCGVPQPSPLVSSKENPADPQPVFDPNFATQSLKPAVKARIRCQGSVLVVENKGNEDWPSLAIVICSDPATGYRTSIAPLKSGETLKVPLSQFENDAGEKFDSSTRRPVKASIDGRGFTPAIFGL
jgi:hypothetical protein